MADVQMLSNWSCDSPKTLVASSVVRPFHTDPRALMERYFDVHLAVSPWGTREVIFRLPQECLSVPLARRYGVEAWSVDEHTLVVLRTDFMRRRGVHAGRRLAQPASASVRAELATGGRRALYLAWLASLGNPDQYGASEVQELEAEEEPPVPAGLTTLGPGLCALAEILCVDPRLLQVMRQREPRCPVSFPGASTEAEPVDPPAPGRGQEPLAPPGTPRRHGAPDAGPAVTSSVPGVPPVRGGPGARGIGGQPRGCRMNHGWAA